MGWCRHAQPLRPLRPQTRFHRGEAASDCTASPKSRSGDGRQQVYPILVFSALQRGDSAWANDLIPELADYATGALPNGPQILPAFVRVDCETDEIRRLNPRRCPLTLKKPEDFDDSWSDPLTKEDKKKIQHYFAVRDLLRDHFGFIQVSAGGSSVTVDLNRDRRDIGISFECPVAR